MLAFLESLYLISVEEEGADSSGALLTEVGADEDYSREMELEAYRAALKLLVPDVDPDLEPPPRGPAGGSGQRGSGSGAAAVVDRSWKRAESASGIDMDSGSYAIPGAEL
jgi:hypothetical protein